MCFILLVYNKTIQSGALGNRNYDKSAILVCLFLQLFFIWILENVVVIRTHQLVWQFTSVYVILKLELIRRCNSESNSDFFFEYLESFLTLIGIISVGLIYCTGPRSIIRRYIVRKYGTSQVEQQEKVISQARTGIHGFYSYLITL